MTPLMERVILTMQALGGDREISLREIRHTGQFDNGREVAICLHYLVNREELATVREVSGNPARPAVWKLTDLGRLYRPLLTVGEKSDAGATKPPSRAKPKKGKPAGTVADLVQEIKAEQDAAVAKTLDPARDPRLVKHVDAMLGAADEQIEEERAARTAAKTTPPAPAVPRKLSKRTATPASKASPAATNARPPKSDSPTPRLRLTLTNDGALRVEGGELPAALTFTPKQVIELGGFLANTRDVWDCPF